MKIDVQLSNSVVDAADRAHALERLGCRRRVQLRELARRVLPARCRRAGLLARPDDERRDGVPTQPDAPRARRLRPAPAVGGSVPARARDRRCAPTSRSGTAPGGVARSRTCASAVEATKAILQSWQDGTRIEFRGEYTTHTLMTPAFNPGPNPFGVPKVLVGALGPKMNQMAAEVADGILVMPFNSDRHMRERTWPAIEAGLQAGRSDARRSRGDGRGARRRRPQRRGARKPRAGCVRRWRSTARRPRTARCSTSRAGATLQPELNALSKRGEWADDDGARHRRNGRHARSARHTRRRSRRRSSSASATVIASAPTSPGITRATISSPTSSPRCEPHRCDHGAVVSAAWCCSNSSSSIGMFFAYQPRQSSLLSPPTSRIDVRCWSSANSRRTSVRPVEQGGSSFMVGCRLGPSL